AADGRGLRARGEILPIARRHDAEDQSQAYPYVCVSHVRTPSVVKPHLRQNMPASMITSKRRPTAEPPSLGPRAVFIFLYGLVTMGKPVSGLSMLSLLSALIELLVT